MLLSYSIGAIFYSEKKHIKKENNVRSEAYSFLPLVKYYQLALLLIIPFFIKAIILFSATGISGDYRSNVFSTFVNSGKVGKEFTLELQASRYTALFEDLLSQLSFIGSKICD
jgi:hypothetical protein